MFMERRSKNEQKEEKPSFETLVQLLLHIDLLGSLPLPMEEIEKRE